MDDIADMHYPNDTMYIFMTLAIPVKFLAKVFDTKIMLACLLYSVWLLCRDGP
jgi:hypothetical protein